MERGQIIEINFEEYLNCDTNVMALKLCMVHELINKILSGSNLSKSEEECEEITPPYSTDAVNCIEKLKSLFSLSEY